MEEPRVLAQSHCGSWVTLTIAPFRVEPSSWGRDSGSDTVEGPGMRGVVVVALSTAQPDVGVAIPTAVATELGLPGARQV